MQTIMQALHTSNAKGETV